MRDCRGRQHYPHRRDVGQQHRRSEVRSAVSGAHTGGVRIQRRSDTGRDPGFRGYILVRGSDLPRESSRGPYFRCAYTGVEFAGLLHSGDGVEWLDLFPGVLGVACVCDPARHGAHQVLRVVGGTAPDRRRHRAPHLGVRRGRGRWGRVFTASAELQQGDAPFWALFWPSLAANVGYWVTLSLNIPDFTRYARSQRSQVVGQAIGLPLTMTAFSFIGIAVTAATIVVFDEAIWDPVQLVTRLTGDVPALLILAMFVIAIAQISTNMAANVVSPSFDFSNLAPKYISFRTSGIITAVIIGILSFPWLLLETAGAYVFTWLVGYGSLLGAIGAVMIADYWILRRCKLDLAELYKMDGRYAYSGGWNWRAIAAVAARCSRSPFMPLDDLKNSLSYGGNGIIAISFRPFRRVMDRLLFRGGVRRSRCERVDYPGCGV